MYLLFIFSGHTTIEGNLCLSSKERLNISKLTDIFFKLIENDHYIVIIWEACYVFFLINEFIEKFANCN